MQYAHSLLHLLLCFLMAMDLKAPREIRVLLAFLGEMVTLAFQDNQVSLGLLAPLESVNHVQLVLLERMESQEDLDDLESVDCLDLQVSKAQLACLDSLV